MLGGGGAGGIGGGWLNGVQKGALPIWGQGFEGGEGDPSEQQDRVLTGARGIPANDGAGF